LVEIESPKQGHYQQDASNSRDWSECASAIDQKVGHARSYGS